MSSPLTRLQARIAGQLARERMGERFAAQVNYEATPVAGLGLARVDGQLVNSTVGEEKSAGDLVAMANVGRPAAAIYSPQGGAAVVIAAAATSEVGGGVTVHGQLSGLGADDHTHYLNIERGDARYYTELEEDAWRAAHIALPDIHHNHATAAAPLSIDGSQYISLLYNTTLAKDGSNKLGVNVGYNFAWTNSHNWAMNTTLSSAGIVIPPGIAPGYGWSLVNPTSGDATLTIPNIYVGNLHAQAFIADVARADVGEEVWTRSRAVLAEDLQLPKIDETVDLVVEVPPGIDPTLMDLFGANHYVRLRIFDTSQGLDIADAWGTVTRKASLDKASVKAERPSAQHPDGVAGAPAEQGYSFKLLYSDAAADPEAVPPKEGAIILAGALAMGYGLPGDAFVLVTVIKAGAPYTAYYRWGINLADGSVRSDAYPWEGQYWKLLTRIGNLEGQVDTAFGGALHGAGLYSENVYLKGRIVIAAGSDVPWSAVSGSGRPQDNATYGATWDQVSGAGKPQDNATRGATWNVDMTPPGYLKAPGSTPGLYMTGTDMGYWNGSAWNTYLDSSGNFVFSSAPDVPQQGDTQLAYFAGKTVTVNGQTVTIPARLAGKLYTLLIRDEYNNPIAAEDGTFWHKTWWADTNTGALHAGTNGEVMLHNWGLSIVAYTGDDITPSNNVKALSFFDDTDSAIANVERARARIWAGRDMDPWAAGSTYQVTSMLQLEVSGSASGYIDTDDRPRLALFNYAHMQGGRILEASDWDEIHLYASHGVSSIVDVQATSIQLQGNVWVNSMMPMGGSKLLGDGSHRFEALYARTVYADSVVAPQFTGMNTVGVELVNSSYTINAAGDEHIWGQSANNWWTVAHADNGQAFFNPADQQHIVVDQTGWYRVSYSITFNQHDHATFVRVFAVGGAVAYDTLHAMSSSWRVSASGDMYLTAGQKLSLVVKSPVGIEPGNYGRFVMIRSGTNGMPSAQMWDSSGNAHIRSASASAAQLVVESTNAGGVMDLRVTGQITTGSGRVDGVNVLQMYNEWESHKSGADIDNTLEHRNQGPHPQYLLRAEVGSLVATHQYVNEMVAAGVASGENIPHSSLLGLNQGDDHPQYVHGAMARTITARHTFSPVVVGAPFLLGTNALGQLVTGLNAEYVGGHTWDEIAMTPGEVLAALLQVDGEGSLLNADLLDGLQGFDYAKSSIIVGAGAGLTGGGQLTASFSLAVGAGAGIEVLADTVGLAASVAGEGLLYNTGVLSLNPALAGAGLTYNAGELAVGQGFGISVSADAIAVDVTPGYTWTGPHIFQSTITARHIAPELTDTYDLGTSVYWWRQQYVSQINATVFAESTVQLMGGWFMVPKWAGTLPAVDSGAVQIDLGPDAAPNIANNDVLLIRAHDASGNIKVEYIKILSLASGTTYNVQRDLAGAHVTDPTWADGTPFALLGQAGDGRIEFNAYDTPRISLIKQGAAYNVQTEIIRIGDINGLGGLTQQTWGIFIGDANQYLKYDGTTLSLKGNGSGLTNIDGGSITTGTIDANRITAVSLAAVRANIATLSALRADLGNVTAGSIVVGDASNKLWLNDSNDHGLAIGGLTKSSAPFKVDADGTMHAGKADLTGSLSTDDGVVRIAQGITFTVPSAGSGTNWISWKPFNLGVEFAKIESVTAVASGSDMNMKIWIGAPWGNQSGWATRNATVSINSAAYTAEADNKTAVVRFQTYLYNVTRSAYRVATLTMTSDINGGSIAMSANSAEFSGGVFSVRTSASATADATGGYASLQVFQITANKDAFMTFHISNDYAVYFGLDGTTNDLFVGGWSMGNVKYKIWHNGNLPKGAAGNWWDRVGWIDSSGVFEAGRYIDFHNADTGTEDYSVRLQTDGGTSNLSINGSAIWHAGNFIPGNYATLLSPNFSGSPKISGNAIMYSGGNFNSCQIFTLYSNDIRSDSIIYFRTSNAGAWQTLDTGDIYSAGSIQAAGYLKTSNSYGTMQLGPQNNGWCHFSTDRAYFYMDHGLSVNGVLFNYNGDWTLGRGTNGVMTNRLTFYTWGTYVYNHLTIEDVFALTNFQASQPNTPASGVKIYAYNNGGNLQLRVRFSNSVDRALQLASS